MSNDFGSTGIDPEWYDTGVGSEAWKRKREGERAAVHERIEQDREAVLNQLKARIAELEATVDTLPKCNRLVDGKIVCDKPMHPGMTIFLLHLSGGTIDEREVVSVSRHQVSWTKPDSRGCTSVFFSCCFDSLEAAKATKGK
jgi:hypothetical protein